MSDYYAKKARELASIQNDATAFALLAINETLLRLTAPPPPVQPNPPARPPSATPWPPQPQQHTSAAPAPTGGGCQVCGKPVRGEYKTCYPCGKAQRAQQADCPTCGKPNSVKPPYAACYTCNQQARAQQPQQPPPPPQHPAPQYAPGAYSGGEGYDSYVEAEPW